MHSKTRCGDDLVMDIAPLCDYEALRSQWLTLETRADCTFFNSWAWAGTWIRLLPRSDWPIVCRVLCANQLVAIAVFGRRRRWRLGIPFRQRFLNTSGHQEIDSIHIEMNQFMAAPGFEVSAIRTLYRALGANDRRLSCDELILAGMRSGDQWNQLALEHGFSTTIVEKSAPYVDLEQIRTSGKDYVELLRKKVRYTVRRAQTEYRSSLGEARLTRANNAEQAGEFLHGLARLHEKRWTRKGQQGAFATPAFCAFHQSLIVNYFEAGYVDLFRIECGATVIGFVYAFRYRDVAWFYQCGFDYAALPTYNQPGYFALSMVIAHYAGTATKAFEFLAGESDYKRRLANSSRSLFWLEVQRPGFNTALLRLYRRLLRSRRAQ
jgi:CelD/BcsL family acetyltransferase involved in cellulose biosynthesis